MEILIQDLDSKELVKLIWDSTRKLLILFSVDGDYNQMKYVLNEPTYKWINKQCVIIDSLSDYTPKFNLDDTTVANKIKNMPEKIIKRICYKFILKLGHFRAYFLVDALNRMLCPSNRVYDLII